MVLINKNYSLDTLKKIDEESRECLRKIHTFYFHLRFKTHDAELAAAAQLVYDEAKALRKSMSLDRSAEVVGFHLAVKGVVAVLESPRNVHRINELDQIAAEAAPGKPSAWAKFWGAVTLLVGVAMTVLSVLGLPFTGGLSGFGIFAGGGVMIGGIALITHGCRKHRLARAVDGVATLARDRLAP